MNTIAIYFVALFAVATALPLVKEDFENKIVGGSSTTIEKHPHQLSLRWNGFFLCGASLLSETVGLTAAHCLNPYGAPSEYSITAGSTLRSGDANAQFRSLSRFVLHPQNDPYHGTHDVGLMFWAKPLSFGSTIRAIKLPEQSSPVPYGEICTVSGWGAIREGGPLSDQLQVVEKPIISNEECNLAYNGQVTDDMMCAGVPQGGLDACHGDSGGPLLVNNVILGVVSWGYGCARPGYPGVYARVSYFTDWITEEMKQ